MSASRQLRKNLDCFIILIMTSLVRYLTHPQVKIDPAVPVLSWGLNDVGRARTEALANTGKLVGVTQVISSGERKAIETAEIIAAKLDIDIEVREAMHENDRSATGFLVPDEFEAVTDQFFMQPFVSIRGCERAIDAQSRVVREVEHVLARNRSGDVIFVGHGAVGTLLFCHYSGLAIDRPRDQPAGGGHCFAFSQKVPSRAASLAPLRGLVNFSFWVGSVADRLNSSKLRLNRLKADAISEVNWLDGLPH
jgi:broad specificity phosphatase PhoE